MAQLSYISTSARAQDYTSASVPTDESIGAILFDISGFDKPFDKYPLLYHNFKGGKIQRISSLDDALLLGITNDGFLNGLIYYHLSQYFNFIGGNHIIYIAIADCSENWDVLQYMQQQTSGKLFHIGVWTTQPIWCRKEGGTLGFTPLITDLQAQADEINGKIGQATHSMTPLHIILSGNSSYIESGDITYKDIPDAVELNCPKVSVALVQNGTDEIHQAQSQMPLHAPVGSIGLFMACLSLCGVEESIASLEQCDLNKNEGFTNPEWGVGNSNTPINTVHQIWANEISGKGYIIPISYEGIEASYYFSSDQTLANGDYGTIANNRIMHKCRRGVCTALMPYVNSHQVFDSGTSNISQTSIATITQSIATIFDSIMKNKRGQNQINDYQVEFLSNENLLEDDTVSLKLTVQPVNYNGYISEEVAHEV